MPTDAGAVPCRTGHERCALAAGLLWVLLLAGGQFLLGGRLAVVPWLALGPLVTAMFARWRATLLVSAAVVTAVAALSADSGDLISGTGAVRVAGSAALAGFAVTSSRVRVDREARIRRVTEVATVAQTAILHPVPSQVGNLDLASRYVSATEDALVGGDLFDVLAGSTSVRLVVGDVRGKGLPAVHAAAAVLSAFRHHAPGQDVSLVDLAERVEVAVRPRLGPEDFVTAVFCELHLDGRLDVVSCGHPAPLRIPVGGTAGCLDVVPGAPLGLGDGTGRPVLHSRWTARERLLLFTDGLYEARDGRGRFFDLAEAGAVVSVRTTTGPADLERALDDLLLRVHEHVGGRVGDDLAVLLVEPRPA